MKFFCFHVTLPFIDPLHNAENHFYFLFLFPNSYQEQENDLAPNYIISKASDTYLHDQSKSGVANTVIILKNVGPLHVFFSKSYKLFIYLIVALFYWQKMIYLLDFSM